MSGASEGQVLCSRLYLQQMDFEGQSGQTWAPLHGTPDMTSLTSLNPSCVLPLLPQVFIELLLGCNGPGDGEVSENTAPTSPGSQWREGGERGPHAQMIPAPSMHFLVFLSWSPCSEHRDTLCCAHFINLGDLTVTCSRQWWGRGTEGGFEERPRTAWRCQFLHRELWADGPHV